MGKNIILPRAMRVVLGCSVLFLALPAQTDDQFAGPAERKAIIEYYGGVDPYDWRGLTIDPGATEPAVYDVPVLEDSECSQRSQPSKTPPENPRLIAEWEPVQGAVIRYPLGISVDAVKTIASELRVYVLCSGGQQSSATSAFQSGGVNMGNITFVNCPTDSYWTRDYSAWWVECGPAGQRSIQIVDTVYQTGGKRPNDDKVPSVLADFLKLPTYYPMNYVCQGGNIMGDSATVGASTDRIKDENPGKSLESLQKIGKNYCGFSTYYCMTDPAYPDDYIKHIDCWAKFIPGNKVLVKRVPAGSKDYNKFEQAAADWSGRKNAKGEKYEVVRIDGPADAPYCNNVILNDRVLFPAKGTSADDKAFEQLQAAFGSAYRIVKVRAAQNAPWLGTDSIHCRVNSVPKLAR